MPLPTGALRMSQVAASLTLLLTSNLLIVPSNAQDIQLGPRPYYLIDKMEDGPLKQRLAACIGEPVERTPFSIAHRGAPLQFPEHSREGYMAAARMGAGIIECDVTFTKDKELVCRHAQNDLHTSTNILETDLAQTCVKAFAPATSADPASAECRSSEITLAQFKTLEAKMDGANKDATTIKGYMSGNPPWRTSLYGERGTVMSHKESIELIKSLGGKFTPELKSPSVDMPFKGFTQLDYAQKLIDEYKEAGVPASDVWPQSFNLADVRYWIEHEPEFGAQAVYLDGRYTSGIDPLDPATFKPTMGELKAMGVNYLAPPIWMLLKLNDDGEIVPSPYALEAVRENLNLVPWSLERSGPLSAGGGWYYKSVNDAVDGDGKLYQILSVLSEDIGISGIFSDWPATTSFYANCMGYK
ncbi:MAG: glycerophosphodiester phosphodiesterase [Rhodobacteraceae bacterium]|nr:glycerophosphodiester phosphodiesterase [Paracoccaceae bacterium]